jgi:hypothetical protein
MCDGGGLHPLHVVVIAGMAKFVDVLGGDRVGIFKKYCHGLNGAGAVITLSRTGRLPGLVHILAMTNFDDVNSQSQLFDRIQNAVLTLPNSVSLTAGQFP